MNWWLAICWFVTCVLVGAGIYRRQVNQVRDYVSWVAFCDHLHQAIGFALQPLPQIVAEYLPVCRGGCRLVLSNYLDLLNAKVDLTREQCQLLTSDSVVGEFLYQLGRTGRETEQNKIVAMRALLSERVQQTKHDLKTKASIMFKLLIIIGIAGGILWM